VRQQSRLSFVHQRTSLTSRRRRKKDRFVLVGRGWCNTIKLHFCLFCQTVIAFTLNAFKCKDESFPRKIVRRCSAVRVARFITQVCVGTNDSHVLVFDLDTGRSLKGLELGKTVARHIAVTPESQADMTGCEWNSDTSERL
jgi:hypothetical protein